MYNCRKLNELQPGIQESFSIAIQYLITFFVLNILMFYYEWRLGLYLLGFWPLAFIANAMFQQVMFNCNIISAGIILYILCMYGMGINF